MWPFSKKPVMSTIAAVKKPKQVDFEIPYEHLPEIIQLSDDVACKNTRMAKFLLWKRIEEIIPSVKAVPDARWAIKFAASDRIIVYAKPEVQNVRK